MTCSNLSGVLKESFDTVKLGGRVNGRVDGARLYLAMEVKCELWVFAKVTGTCTLVGGLAGRDAVRKGNVYWHMAGQGGYIDWPGNDRHEQ